MNRPDVKHVSEFLNTGHLGDSEIGSPESGDPVTETMIRLTLDDLVEFDRNPRHAKNAEYDHIKASLLNTGPDGVLLIVTRRPGESKYFPAAGGNTRLSVLKELHRTLKDDKYYFVDCKYVPYKNELSLMVGHLIENDNRADYIFIDRARAICDLYDEMLQDGELSQRKFIERLIDMGYNKLSRAHLSRYQYATSLYQYIPQALDAGMGSKGIDSLQLNRKTLKTFLDTACGGDPDIAHRFDNLVHVVLSDLDGPDGINQDAVADTLLELLAPAAVRHAPDLDVDDLASLLKNLWAKYKHNPDYSVSLQKQTVAPSERSRPEQPGKPYRFSDDEIREREWGEQSEGDPSAIDPNSPSPPSESPHASRTLEESSNSETNTYRSQYKNLTDDTLEHARSLAEAFELDRLVSPFSFERPTGYGYWIDLPDESQSLSESAGYAWWWLFDLSRITEALLYGPALLERDPRLAESRFTKQYRAIAEGLGGLGRDQIDRLPPEDRNAEILGGALNVLENQIPRRHNQAHFLCSILDSEYATLFELMNAVRSIRRIMPHLREKE